MCEQLQPRVFTCVKGEGAHVRVQVISAGESAPPGGR